MEPVYTLSEPQVWAIAVACAMMLFDVVMEFRFDNSYFCCQIY